MRRHFVVLLVLLLSLSAQAQLPDVRVLLDRVSSVDYRVEVAHRGYVGANRVFETSLPLVWPVTVRAGDIYVDGTRLGSSFALEALHGPLQWGERSYRGQIRFVAQGDEILVVNVVDLENYLRGVVPAEMAASWPIEALKAQAVAARTYTLASLDPDRRYDICATVDCQVYAGVSVENTRSDRAIAETRGMVLLYGGDLARTYYHADSGGVIASSAEVWGRSLPYLAGGSDVASSSPHRSWSHTLDAVLLESLLEERGYRLGTIRSARVLSYSQSGRALSLEFSGDAGRAVLAGSALTSLLRDAGLKSTRITMTGALTVRGDGWGHGVGMSQYGARQMAVAGNDFARILAFYYPRTHLQALATDATASLEDGQ